MPRDWPLQIQPSVFQTLFLITHKVITSSAQFAAKPQWKGNGTTRAELHGTVTAGPGKSDHDLFLKLNSSPFWDVKRVSENYSQKEGKVLFWKLYIATFWTKRKRENGQSSGWFKGLLNLERKPCYNTNGVILAFLLVVIFVRTFPGLTSIANWFSFFTRCVGRVVKQCLSTVKSNKVVAELHEVQQCKARI